MKYETSSRHAVQPARAEVMDGASRLRKGNVFALADWGGADFIELISKFGYEHLNLMSHQRYRRTSWTTWICVSAVCTAIVLLGTTMYY